MTHSKIILVIVTTLLTFTVLPAIACHLFTPHEKEIDCDTPPPEKPPPKKSIFHLILYLLLSILLGKVGNARSTLIK